MTAGQGVIVEEHCALELKILLKERDRFYFLGLLVQTLVVRGERCYILHIPDIAGQWDVLVAVDLLLLVSPVGKRSRVCPHGHLGRIMNEFEMARDGIEHLLGLPLFDPNLEQRVVVPVGAGVLRRNGGELLIGRIIRRSNIVGEQNGVSYDVS